MALLATGASLFMLDTIRLTSIRASATLLSRSALIQLRVGARAARRPSSPASCSYARSAATLLTIPRGSPRDTGCTIKPGARCPSLAGVTTWAGRLPDWAELAMLTAMLS